MEESLPRLRLQTPVSLYNCILFTLPGLLLIWLSYITSQS